MSHIMTQAFKQLLDRAAKHW